MSLIQGAQLQASQPASAVRRAITRAWPELNSPAAWLVALILVIMPLIANGFFLTEIFGTTLILGIIALSLMFLAGYGGMVSLMQLTIAGFAGYMVAVIGVSGNANISMGWPWWLATPIALVLATIFGTLGGALAVRTEGIYTIMITLAIGAAFYYFTNQNWAIFNGHTGINTVATPYFLGVDWRSDIPFYYLALGVAALCYFAVQYLSRAVRSRFARRARQPPAHGGAGLQCQRASGGRLCVRVVRRGTWGGPASLELSANLAWLGQRRSMYRHPDCRHRRRHHAADRSLHWSVHLRDPAHLCARLPCQVRARRQSLPAFDRPWLPRHRVLVI
jgi:hypothetical protein